MKLTNNFNLSEFTFSQTAFRKGIDNTPSKEVIENLTRLANVLETIRANVGGPINISSGYRSPELNKAIGGSPTSDHMEGNAADFNIRGMTPRAVARAIIGSGIKFDQLILEGVSKDTPNGQWIHLSTDPKMRGEVLTMTRQSGKIVYKKGLG